MPMVGDFPNCTCGKSQRTSDFFRRPSEPDDPRAFWDMVRDRMHPDIFDLLAFEALRRATRTVWNERHNAMRPEYV